MNPPQGRLRRWLTQYWPQLGLAIALLLAIGARVYTFYIGTPYIHIAHDSEHYIAQAEALLQGQMVADYFPNGYPLLLAGMAKLLPGASWLVRGQCLNFALGLANVLLLWRLGKHIGLPSVLRVLACLTLALGPNILDYQHQLLSEPSASFTLLLGLVLLTHPNPRWQLWAGLPLGYSGLIRSVHLLIGLSAVLLAKKGLPASQWRRLLALWALPLLLYSGTNYTLNGTPALNGNTMINVLVTAYTDMREGPNWRVHLQHPHVDTLPEALEAYFCQMIAHPQRFVRNRLLNLQFLWFTPRYSPAWGLYTGRSPKVAAAITLAHAPFFVGGLLTLVAYRQERLVWLLAWPVLFITAFHVALFAGPRFAYCAEPFAVLLTLYGLSRWWGLLRPAVPLSSSAATAPW